MTLSPADYGHQLAAAKPPLSPAQVENAAQILALLDEQAVAA